MAKKDDFDKIDTNKDGFISREEFDAADESAGVERDKLNWFLRLITLGDRFDIKDFWDRVKKSIVEFVILVFGVTVSFGIEQQGGESDNRHDGIENLQNLRQEVDEIIAYTDEYIEQIDWVTDMYQKQYDKWEKDNDSIFIYWQLDEEEPDGKYYFSPMGMYNNRNPFDPPRVNFDAIKLDGTFRLLPRNVGLKMTEIYDGTELKYLIENTGVKEERYVNQFIDRVANRWVFDLPWVNLDYNEFWIENRKYIQNDKFMKYNLFKRLDLWQWSVKDQLQEYRNSLTESTKMLDSVIAVRDSEFEFIWWVLNPKD
ncbi:EF-hand domain-containing protein [bacterium]|nr:EF-hand domain-containing protein [bacterium]|tara:strand:- start:11409 stop:12347 length:939 start_codon:yes stop_codon:yes gene_type:complete